MDLAVLSAAQLVQMIQDGEITSSDLVESCLSRIEAVDDDVQAWTHLDPEFARKQAADLDTYRATGAPCGPLHGIPVGIKDIFDTKDYPTENGTVLNAGRQPTKDCSVVNQLKAAGAVIMGKTVTTEMAVYAPGKTRNPHDPERTPGGSSSGSAAAVAAGMVPLAVGSQTNGSVIRPASFCGVVGFKPTHGRISRAGVLPLSRTLDHVGVFARTLEDAALLAENLMSHDPGDLDTQPSPAPRLRNISLQEPPSTPRFAFVKSPAWDLADPDAQLAFEEMNDFLGDQSDEVSLPPEFNDAVGNLRKIMFADLARYLDAYVKRDESKISEILIGMIREGETVSAVDYNSSVDQIAPLSAWVRSLCEEYDAILTPATCGEAPLGLEATGDPVFCSIWSYLGVPAVTVPLMEGANGMPLGVQLVGPRCDDARLLRSARWLATEVANAH
jgi:Asp-tRNA(Asn)/Glu-tRNA(Gln) amidotransferase A subunit family amidase